MYMPGRLRTADSPFNTWICLAVYSVLFVAFSSVIRCLSEGGIRAAANSRKNSRR